MRIANITISEKQLSVALTSVYGIGSTRARTILEKSNIPLHTLPSQLTSEQEQVIRNEVKQFTLEGDLRRQVASDIKRLQDLSTYKGRRHSLHLPVRGQRTKTNARTRKGKKVTMGSGKIKLQKK